MGDTAGMYSDLEEFQVQSILILFFSMKRYFSRNAQIVPNFTEMYFNMYCKDAEPTESRKLEKRGKMWLIVQFYVKQL